MARLPQPGGDSGNWGSILNDYLSQAHSGDGSLKPDTVGQVQIQNDAISTAKLAPAVRSSLTKADTAYQKPSEGVPLSDLQKTELDAAYAPARLTQDVTKISVVASPSAFPGIDPTGVADSSAGLQAAIDATPSGGTLIIPGVIRLSTALTVTDRSITIQIDGTINSDAGASPFIISATPETVYDVSAVAPATITNGTGVTQTALQVTLSSGSPSWQRGDIVKLIADDEVPGARLGDGTVEARFGQYHVVQSASGSTVIIAGTLRDACTTGIRITRMPKHSVIINGTGAFGTIGKPVMLRHLLAPRVQTHIYNSGGQGLHITGCYQAFVDVTVDSAPDDGTIYGYGLTDNSGANGEYRICASRVRHAYTDDTPRVPVGSSEVWKYGRSFGHHVTGVATATSNTAWDTHAASANVRFDTLAIDCIGGIGLRGRRHSGHVSIYRPVKSAWKFFSEPNRGTDSWGHDIEVEVYDPPSGSPVGSVVINDGTGFAKAGVRETRPSSARVRVHADTMPAVALNAVNATLLHSVTYLTTSGSLAPEISLTNSVLRTSPPLALQSTIIASDGFSGTNGNIATGRNTDNEFGGSTLSWTVSPSSRLGIQSGMLVSGTVDGLGGIYLPISQSNVRATIRIRDINSDAEILHVDIRRQTNSYVNDGTDNAWTVILGAGNAQLAKKVAGVLTKVGDVFSYPAESDVAIQAYGSLISLVINGEEKISVTDNDVSSGNYVGIYKTRAGNIRNPNWIKIESLVSS